MNRREIALCLIGSMTAISALWVLFDRLDDERVGRERLRYQRMVHAIDELYGQWREGPEEWMCEEFFDPDIRYEKVYLRCNADLLRCRLGRVEHIHFRRFVGTPLWNRFGIVVGYTDGPLKREFILYDDCRQAVLPEGVYGLGEFRSRDDLLWDNFGRNIAFDRTLVSRQDVLNWLDTADVERESALREANGGRSDRHLPARGLLVGEMRAYCRFRGGRLMRAHVWDAAAFVPADPKKPGRDTTLRTPYPWTRDGRNSFLERAERDDPPPEPGDCLRAYVKGCEPSSPRSGNVYGLPSWSGMFQTLGGTMEATDNPLRPGRNLKVSSRELPPYSPWHRLGRRGGWDGRGLLPRNVNFGRHGMDEELTAPLEIGFRCMR